MSEIVYSQALEAVAMGATYEETRRELIEAFPSIDPLLIYVEMTNAVLDAKQQGVELEDIDPSWH